MEVLKQLSVFLKNEPGVLARLCQDFKDNQINILALSVSDTVDHAVLRLVVSDPLKALHLLEEHGVLVVETEVLGLRAVHKPGVLGEIANRLALAKVNIEYAYGTAGAEKEKGLIIVRVDNLESAKSALKEF